MNNNRKLSRINSSFQSADGEKPNQKSKMKHVYVWTSCFPSFVTVKPSVIDAFQLVPALYFIRTYTFSYVSLRSEDQNFFLRVVIAGSNDCWFWTCSWIHLWTRYRTEYFPVSVSDKRSCLLFTAELRVAVTSQIMQVLHPPIVY